jgi:alpha-ketoglutaric semialdehyde dehydrogenase
MQAVLRQLSGQLTGTVLAEGNEFEAFADTIALLEARVGRLLCNGMPTGVEVCSAMHHGGPYPATTDARFTSVGSAGIERFVRPVCYQSWPEALLPVELHNSNPMDIWRLVDNARTKEGIEA